MADPKLWSQPPILRWCAAKSEFPQDVDEDHIKNTSCTDPTDHQEHPIHKVFHCLSYLGFKRKEKEQLNKISDNFHQWRWTWTTCTAPGLGWWCPPLPPHQLPSSSQQWPNMPPMPIYGPAFYASSSPSSMWPTYSYLWHTIFFHVIFVFQMCSDLFVNKPYLYRYK